MTLNFGEGRDPELAIVILAVGAPADLIGALDSLAMQDVPREIVVVNSGGGDMAPIRAVADPSVRFIERQERLFAGAARNVGVRETKAPFVAFMASDHILTPNWCAARIARHRAGAAAVACAVINSDPRNLVAWAHHLAILARRLPGIPAEHALRYGVSYSREVLERTGQFREDLRIGEDTEFNERLPLEPVWAPEVQTIHRNATRFAALMADQYQRGWRSGFHAPQESKRLAFLKQVLIRFRSLAGYAVTATSGTDRVFAVASLPIVLLASFNHGLGLQQGQRDRESALAR